MANNIFSGLNLADLATLLQARSALPGAAPAATATANSNLRSPTVPSFILNAASLGGLPRPAAATALTAATPASAARRPAPDPPGSHSSTEGGAAALAAAVSSLRGKRPALSTAPGLQEVAGMSVKKARLHRSWDEMFGALVNYHARHASTAVPLNNPEDQELGLWVQDQRRRKTSMSAQEKYKLDLIGFQWEVVQTPSLGGGTTLGTVNALASLAAQIPASNAASAGQLLSRTRNIFEILESYKQGAYAPPTPAVLPLVTGEAENRIVSLNQTVSAAASTGDPNEIGKKSPDANDAPKKRVRTFDENFNALLDYKKVHGNVDVPQKYDEDRKLGIWVKNVRQHPQRHTQEQRDRLDSIGFKWRKLQLDEQWNEAFKQLLEYKEKYGDCNVPSRWKKCPALARWVHTQRTMYRRNKLLDDRKEKLEDAGFVWDCNAMRDDEAFHENYEKLLAFKKVRGHCMVPNKYRRDRPLGRWAAKMRDLYCYDQLDADRRKALTDIGFVWKPPIVETPKPASPSASSETAKKDASGEVAVAQEDAGGKEDSGRDSDASASSKEEAARDDASGHDTEVHQYL